MQQIRTAPRLAAAVVLALAVAACDDDSSVAGLDGDCAVLEQTQADVTRGLEEGKARVRINLLSRLGVEVSSGEGVWTSGVELYRGNNCVRAGGATLTRLGTVENSMGGAVADVAVDAGPITHILLRQSEPEAGTRRVRQQKIALAQPVTLQAGTRTEIFLALDSIAGSGEVAARFVAAGPVQHDAGTVMVFEPGRAASASTRSGFTLDMPGGSLAQPTVYGIVEHDVGGLSSLFGIMPQGALGAEARVSFPVNRARIAQGLAMSDYGARMGGESVASTMAGNVVSMNVSRLGSAGMGTDRLWSQGSDGTIVATPEAAAPAPAPDGVMPVVNNLCSQRLAANRATHFGRLPANAGIRISDCENVAPFVHILLINMGYTINPGLVRPRVLLPATWSGYNLTLKTISQHAAAVGAYAAVNGFQWTGDHGFGPGVGVARGTLWIDGARRSPAFDSPEAIIAFTKQVNGVTSATLIDKGASQTVNLGTYNWNAVPSTTSIVKNGVCSRSPSTDYNRYSAIGFGNGILVLVSSISDETTTPYELCSVFEGLNLMGGAILMDGSTAAAMSWLSTHINPITGGDTYLYGTARHIAYAVGSIK